MVGLGAAALAPRLISAAFGRSAFAQEASELASVADGRRNALPVIRSMLERVEQRGGGEIRLPEGTYLLLPESAGPPTLTMPANTRLIGAGRDRTIIKMGAKAFGHVINAPYGAVEIYDLTVDGNADERVGQVGHNLRVEGDRIRLERLKCINAVSYGIAVGQRRFARDVVIRDVDILNSGADGIDLKNRLDRTGAIILENLTVKGFGRPDPSLASNLVGTAADGAIGKAGIDLRGKCDVRGVTIIGVRRGRDGLRFRHGEVGVANGSGAHGSRARNITVRGEMDGPQGSGITVMARDIVLEESVVDGVSIALRVGSQNLSVSNSRFSRSSRAALFAKATTFSEPTAIDITSSVFASPKSFTLDDVDLVHFTGCRFCDLADAVAEGLAGDSHVVLKECSFEAVCT